MRLQSLERDSSSVQMKFSERVPRVKGESATHDVRVRDGV